MPRAVASFWMGEPLSFLEQIVMCSYLRNGYDFTLYTEDLTRQVPDGVELRDYREILPDLPFAVDNLTRKDCVIISDIFRVRLLLAQEVIWVDMDAYCLRPYEQQPYLFGVSPAGQALTGVMALPQSSLTLQALDAYLMAPCPIPLQSTPEQRAAYENRIAQNEVWDFRALRWGASGPKALDHFLIQHDEKKHAQPTQVFYPFRVWDTPFQLLVAEDKSGLDLNGASSLHFFGHTKRRIREYSSLPPHGSIIERLCKFEGVNPRDFPIPKE